MGASALASRFWRPLQPDGLGCGCLRLRSRFTAASPQPALVASCGYGRESCACGRAGPLGSLEAQPIPGGSRTLGEVLEDALCARCGAFGFGLQPYSNRSCSGPVRAARIVLCGFPFVWLSEGFSQVLPFVNAGRSYEPRSTPGLRTRPGEGQRTVGVDQRMPSARSSQAPMPAVRQDLWSRGEGEIQTRTRRRRCFGSRRSMSPSLMATGPRVSMRTRPAALIARERPARSTPAPSRRKHRGERPASSKRWPGQRSSLAPCARARPEGVSEIHSQPFGGRVVRGDVLLADVHGP